MQCATKTGSGSVHSRLLIALERSQEELASAAGTQQLIASLGVRNAMYLLCSEPLMLPKPDRQQTVR
jgi:hypothetical protein